MSSYKDTKTGLWYCQFYYTDWKGQRRHTCKRNFARKKDADLYERQFKSKEQRETITMNSLIDLYIDHMRTLVKMGTIERTTFNTKKGFIENYIRDYFGDAHIDGVDMDVVNQWISSLSRPKKRYSKAFAEPPLLASRTIKSARSVLSQIFDYAIKTHRAKENPVKYSEIPPNRTNDVRANLWTLDQYKLFHSKLKKEEHRVLYNVFFWTGMRIGEILALTPSDILPYKISVTKTWIETANGGGYMKPKPKNKYSIREVEIPHELYFQIQDYLMVQYRIKPKDRIFEVTASAIRTQLRYWTKKLGLPIISPHTLRHSYASLLFNVTGDLMLVSSQLGHANIITTGKVYTHKVPGANRAGVDKLEKTTISPQICINDV